MAESPFPGNARSRNGAAPILATPIQAQMDPLDSHSDERKSRSTRAVPSEPPPVTERPVIGLTMGDPLGIGAEVLVKALADPRVQRLARFVIYGQNEVLLEAAERAHIQPFWLRVAAASERAAQGVLVEPVVYDYDAAPPTHDSASAATSAGAGAAPPRAGASASERLTGHPARLASASSPGPSALGGALSKTFVEDAISDALRPPGDRRHLDAIVTAPISKESWAMCGFRWPGHTELLAARSKAKRHLMLFWSPKLSVALATGHISLGEVGNALSIGRVFDPIDLGHAFLARLGVRHPRIAVCGLNPHAGERGLFGSDEERVITPAIELARRQGIDARGPFPGDTIFIAALRGEWDMVVAMYHDQGLIPLKLVARDEAVNCTIGLPFVRTSPDHGTAFDIAGRSVANPGSMRAAIELAARLAAPANRVDQRMGGVSPALRPDRQKDPPAA